jgi:hypothetical protein
MRRSAAAVFVALAGVAAGCGGASPRAIRARAIAVQGSHSAGAALRTALPALARAPVPADRWPGDPRRFGGIVESREVATLVRPPRIPLRLYIVETRAGGTCLLLADGIGNCNTAPNFFGGSAFELLDLGTAVAGIVVPEVSSLALRSPAGRVRIPLTHDHAFLFPCPRRAGSSSCAGDRLVATDERGRTAFSLGL